MKLSEFIAKHEITMDYMWIAERPDGIEWENANHFRCALKRPSGENMVLIFSMGLGIEREPTAEDVLGCIAADTASFINCNEDYQEWCDEFGYDAFNEEEMTTFEAVQSQAEDLRSFLPTEAFNELLWEVESV